MYSTDDPKVTTLTVIRSVEVESRDRSRISPQRLVMAMGASSTEFLQHKHYEYSYLQHIRSKAQNSLDKTPLALALADSFNYEISS